jgi:hypothetical protein
VKSALASGLERLEALVEEGRVELSALDKISLADITVDGKAGREAKSIRGLINIMRVGYAHADSRKTISIDDETTPEFEGGLLASRQVGEKPEHFVLRLPCNNALSSVTQPTIMQRSSGLQRARDGP